MNYRQKNLLGLLNAFGGHLLNTDFQKYLFLYTREFQQDPSYEFVPYRFGGFSFQSYVDKRSLVASGYLLDSNDWELGPERLDGDLFDSQSYEKCASKYSALKGNSLLQNVYRRYPYYAINSECASEIMQPEELEAIRSARSKDDSVCFLQ